MRREQLGHWLKLERSRLCEELMQRLAPAPRHYLATPPPQKLEELRQTFEPVWGLPRFRAPSVDELRTCAAHARAHRGGHWFYDLSLIHISEPTRPY